MKNEKLKIKNEMKKEEIVKREAFVQEHSQLADEMRSRLENAVPQEAKAIDVAMGAYLLLVNAVVQASSSDTKALIFALDICRCLKRDVRLKYFTIKELTTKHYNNEKERSNTI